MKNSRSIEYKKYLIARDYKPSIVNKHFAHVSTLSRQQARQKSTNRKTQMSKNVKLIMKYNPKLPDPNIVKETYAFTVRKPHFQNCFSARLYQLSI